MRFEIKRLEVALGRCGSVEEAIGRRLHPRRTARNDDGGRHIRDGCGAECAAAGDA